MLSTSVETCVASSPSRASALIATIREVIRPTVAQPGAGARELGAVLFGGCEKFASEAGILFGWADG